MQWKLGQDLARKNTWHDDDDDDDDDAGLTLKHGTFPQTSLKKRKII